MHKISRRIFGIGYYWLIWILPFSYCPVFSQTTSRAIVKGKIYDVTTNRVIAGVTVKKEGSEKYVQSAVDGSYLIKLIDGKGTLAYELKGFSTKKVKDIPLVAGRSTYLDIYLNPATKSDSIQIVSFNSAWILDTYSGLFDNNYSGNNLKEKAIDAGTDKDLAALLRRLDGIQVADVSPFSQIQSVTINGMGERYNQVALNGQIFPSFDALSRQFPLSAIPVEALSSVGIQSNGNPATQADFSGGTIHINLKDIPERNFYYLNLGGEILPDTYNQEFFNDQRNSSEYVSLPIADRNLPASFPSTGAQYLLTQKNPQEKADLLGLLENNLAPKQSSRPLPGTRFLFGIGAKKNLKNGHQFGITAYLQHQLSSIRDESVVQVGPALTNQTFPFQPSSKPLIQSYSNDINYRFQSQLNAIVNAAILFRKNKISMQTIAGNFFNDTYTERSGIFKPDENTLARKAVSYRPEQRKMLNLQVNGEHALGVNSKLKLDWQLAYNFYQQLNHDERNFLLQQNPFNESEFALATPLVAPLPDRNNVSNSALDANLNAIFTNSSRLWRTQKDHNFSGWANLSFPFTFLKKEQVLKGGIYMQSAYREFYSDLLLYQGNGFDQPQNLIAPDKYYPTGVQVEEYYTKVISSDGFFSTADINADNVGNYTGSGNIGASFLEVSGKLNKKIQYKAGLRFESASQLVSAIEYNYVDGFKNAQIVAINENATVAKYNLLPSAALTFMPLKSLSVQAGYSKTVNRPTLQELSTFRYYDATTFMVKAGNAFLETAEIHNFSASVQWASSFGLAIGVTGFYKDLQQPIEHIITQYPGSKGNYLSTPHNSPNAEVYGIQASIKLPLSENPENWLTYLSVFANGTITNSKVSSGPIRSTASPRVIEHELEGSPNYLLNSGIVFQYPAWPQFSVLFTSSGDYLQAVGSGEPINVAGDKTVLTIPDYRVKGRNQLDLQVSHRFFNSRLLLAGGAQNLLHSPYTIYQDLNGNKKFDDPLMLDQTGNNGGFYKSGTDNTVLMINNQKSFFLRIAYTFK